MTTHVYSSGQDGYHTYRIPALLVTGQGTLLAFCEGRRNDRRDHGDIDLLVKRSEDNGETWSSQEVVYGEPGEVTIGNPCPVLDRDTGTIWLPFCKDNDRVLITRSEDDGRTWSPPEDITASVKLDTWAWYATGPGVGIQLQEGIHRGRLVIPCDHRSPETYENGSHTIISGDGGQTWRLGGVIQHGSNECQVVELSNGTLMMNMRMQGGYRGLRGVARTDDGGASWSDLDQDPNLSCPKCQASLLRYPSDSGEDILLFSNPVSPYVPGSERGERVDMTVRISRDGGKTWPHQRLLHKGPAAYSCLAALPDGDVACLFEAGVDLAYEHIVFERFPLD